MFPRVRLQVTREQSGFTLVELMVVVTIIVILIALLVPALERSMGIALRATCGARMRGMMMVVGQYGSDNRWWVPMHAGHVGEWLWDVNADSIRSLMPYALRRELFHCPSNAAANYDEEWLGGWREQATSQGGQGGGEGDWAKIVGPGSGHIVLTNQWTMKRPGPGPEYRGGLAAVTGYWNRYAARTKMNRLPEEARDTPFILDTLTFDLGQTKWADRDYGLGRPFGSNHMEGNVQGSRDVPAGGNAAFVDTSVHWKTFGDSSLVMNWWRDPLHYYW